jgi:hypothetical protein
VNARLREKPEILEKVVRELNCRTTEAKKRKEKTSHKKGADRLLENFYQYLCV